MENKDHGIKLPEPNENIPCPVEAFPDLKMNWYLTSRVTCSNQWPQGMKKAEKEHPPLNKLGIEKKEC